MIAKICELKHVWNKKVLKFFYSFYIREKYKLLILKLYSAGCTTNYHNTKTEIEQKIDALYNEPKQFCNKCKGLKKNIIKKNRELQNCYKSSNLLSIVSTDNIIKFINSCPDSNCRYPTITSNKPVKSKQRIENPCSVNGRCTETVATPKAQKVKTSPALDAEDPKVRSPKVHVSSEQVREHVNAQESQQEIRSVEAKQDIKPSGNSVGSEPETSGPNVTSNFSPSGESENKTQSFSLLANPANNQLGTGLKDSASQNPPEGESDFPDTTELTNLHRSNIQNGPNIVQDVNNESATSHSNGHLNLVSKISCPGDSIAEAIGSSYTCPRTADRVHYTEQSPDMKAIPDGDTHSGIDDNGSIAVLSVPSKGDNGDLAEYSFTLKQAVSVISSQLRDPDHKNSCPAGAISVENDNETSCNAENGNGLVTDNGNNSDIFSKFVDAISNKDHIVQASAPMGIVLLLGLLFKVN
ncbi:hypothetical protein PVMG_05509 [Plasmodium vivax Mauritania I]|uniref:Variable surface protein Vir18 n=1 Tax=Plasmodium vivax Mauritania I TaxID=1035515 RepID=A0A0J9W3P1_PLAVI|nr:hypothetical protein PVMG_05509 [Plasmodium vivax Mauritania I]